MTTMSTVGMSRPRDATSVAIRTDVRREWNLSRFAWRTRTDGHGAGISGERSGRSGRRGRELPPRAPRGSQGRERKRLY